MDPLNIDLDRWHHHTWVNRVQSLVLLLIMGGFLGLLGWLLWGIDGVVMLLVAGIIGVMFNPSFSPQWIMRLYGAVPIAPRQAPELWSVIARLSRQADLPAQPTLYYIPSQLLNAFAVGGRRNAAIAVTDGLLRQLSMRELTGVLAHEMSHIRNNDLWVMGLADMFSRATSILSFMGQLLLLINLPLLLMGAVTISWLLIVLLIFAPTLSALAQLALSRTREYDADLNAVRLSGDPDGLASALEKIEQVQGSWLERIIMPGRRGPEPSLLRTHPRTRDRVARLMALKSDLQSANEAHLWQTHDAFEFPGEPVRHRPRRHLNGLWY